MNQGLSVEEMLRRSAAQNERLKTMTIEEKRAILRAAGVFGIDNQLTRRYGGQGSINPAPPTPGSVLHSRFLEPLEITQQALAYHISCDVKTINRLVRGRSRVTPALAVKLAAAFETEPQFWLRLQNAVDLYKAAKKEGDLPPSLIS